MIQAGSQVIVDVKGISVEKLDRITKAAVEHFAFSGGLLNGKLVKIIDGPPIKYEVDVAMIKLFSGRTILVDPDQVVPQP